MAKRYLRVGLVWLAFLLAGMGLALAPASRLALAAEEPTASQPPPATSGQTGINNYVPETGHYLYPVFRPYWLKNGGLAQFGFPITEAFVERNQSDGHDYTVQYFERARFEYHPELKGTPYEIQLGLLGSIQTAGRQFAESAPFRSTAQRYYFPETRHSLGGSFKRYWDRNGGLALFGYPISEEISENGFTVQYFERNRFEYHPELAGTAFEVQLGLLGTRMVEIEGYHLPQIYRVTPETGTVVQGRALRVSVFAPGLKPEAIKSTLDGVALNFAPVGANLVAVAPVASDAAIKPRLLRTELTDPSGVLRRFEQSIAIKAGQFDHQLIALDPAVEASLGSAEEQNRERERVFSFYNQVTPQRLWEGRFIWPVNGTISTTYATRRDYVGGGSEIHEGIDIGVPMGTPIRAPQRGRVVYAEFGKVRGNTVILDHGLGLHTAYFHQSRILVKVGDIVNQGDIIGLVGTTGLSTGPHLHWEMRIGSTGIDPEEWVNRQF
jgi:murein DD-endopeptidase MepM/ murein hydrolase activator NlpD